MTDYCAYVDVFNGTDEICLPKPYGLAAAWRLIKGLCGNCTPAAALPFGRISAGCFSGGYSAGYGRLKSNSHGPIDKLSDKNLFKGMSHLQNDGTGFIDTFYNYAVISPFCGELRDAARAREFDNETARPGYYALRDSLTGADCEVTVTQRAALYRMRFPHDGCSVSVDFSNDGLYENGGKVRMPAGEADMELLSEDAVYVCAKLHGLPVHFCLKVRGNKGGLRLWTDGAEIGEKSIHISGGHSFGVMFDAAEDTEITLGLSPKSREIACNDALGNTVSFDEAANNAYNAWNRALSRIEAEFASEEEREIFYSNLYHTLTKPCDFSGESFLYDSEDFVLEFATLWDQYKTQLPLIYTLYPEISSKIVNTLVNACDPMRGMPHTLMMCDCRETFKNNQARMLAEFTVVDAWLRGVPFDAEKALDVMLRDTFEYGKYGEMCMHPENLKSKAYIIDITDACAACALMARRMGRTDAAAKFDEISALWRNAFDETTGLLREGETFYEGTRWNYSFRLMHDMKERMLIAGGPEEFTELADRFFGFSHPEDGSSCCFEGFNNETDMESPYVYHYAGRHDRISEIMDACRRYMYTTGRGGMPGNNDSGGLSSCYLWNCIGLFPVSGTDSVIIGTPQPLRTVMHLANGGTLTISRRGEGIYVKKVSFNNREITSMQLSVGEVINGGEMLFEMSTVPC